MLDLAKVAVSLDMAESDAQRLIEARRPAQIALAWREAADQIDNGSGQPRKRL